MSVYASPVSNVTEYINYYRQLAISHKDLQHDPASEQGDGPAGSMHFMKISGEQVLNALNTAAGFPLMLLELYEIDSSGESVLDVRLQPKGAFMIVDNPANESFPAQEACYAKCERIMTDMLKEIYQHHYAPTVDECQAPFKSFDFNRLSITPVGPIFSNQFGYRVVYDFELQNKIDLTEAPEDGTFL